MRTSICIFFFLILFNCDKEPEYIPPTLDELFVIIGINYSIDPALIKAISYCESYFVTNTNRHEPQLKTNWRYVSSIPKIYRTNELCYYSLGMMQLLPGTAYWLGYEGPPEGLYEVSNNIYIGTKFIKILQRVYPKTEDMYSSYNGGHPLTNTNGTYRNQTYINNVKRKYKQYLSEMK